MREYIIACIPPAEVAARAIAMSQALQRRGGLFVLDKTRERPHVTLYYTILPSGVLHIVRERLARIATAMERPLLVATRFARQERWIDVEYESHAALVTLQRAVIEAVNPLRAGHLRARDAARLPRALPEVRQNIEQYGYRSVGALYRPHLTLTRMANDDDGGVLPVEELEHFSCVPAAIGLFAAGAHGTCVRLLSTFALRS
ncbi:MAG: DUF1045 domain-containing protein [bacterium]|nr:DUF1045 domain-containing protein [bacterium]